MNVSVAICTWNREGLLKQTLDRIMSVRIPNGMTWELLVIDNNSTDRTQSVLTDYAARLPLRSFFEGSPGQSNARNRAIREARGDLIIWTDDDVLVDPEWLTAYMDAADRWSKVAFFGGPITPCFEGEPPRWLQQIYSKIETAFATRDLGQEPHPLIQGKFPFGANMAVRANVQRRYLFDPILGLRPGSQLRSEETTVFEAMARDGLEGRWVPGARVQHFIPKGRQTIKYLRSYYRGTGQLSTLNINQEGGAKLFGRPRWAWRKAIKNELLFWLKRYCFKPESWIDNLIHANTCWGIVFPPVLKRTASSRTDSSS